MNVKLNHLVLHYMLFTSEINLKKFLLILIDWNTAGDDACFLGSTSQSSVSFQHKKTLPEQKGIFYQFFLHLCTTRTPMSKYLNAHKNNNQIQLIFLFSRKNQILFKHFRKFNNRAAVYIFLKNSFPPLTLDIYMLEWSANVLLGINPLNKRKSINFG